MLSFKGNEFEYISIILFIILGLYWFYILYIGASSYDDEE